MALRAHPRFGNPTGRRLNGILVAAIHRNRQRDATVIERQIGEVAVVGVLLDENYFAGTNRFKYAIRNSRLP